MNEERKLSRRTVMQYAAVATPLIAIGCNSEAVNPLVDSGVDAGRDSGMDTGVRDTGTDAGVNPDISLLNAALTAEYGAIAAYTAGAGILSSPPANDPQAANAPLYLQIAARFRDQHRDHANAIVSAINSLGGTPIAESSVTFTAPAGFTGSVLDVLKLATNAEKGAAIAYNSLVKAFSTTDNRFLASVIEGDETQHFIILYSLLKGVAAAGPNIGVAGNLMHVVPTSFVSTLGTSMGLQSVPNFTYEALPTPT